MVDYDISIDLFYMIWTDLSKVITLICCRLYMVTTVVFNNSIKIIETVSWQDLSGSEMFKNYHWGSGARIGFFIFFRGWLLLPFFLFGAGGNSTSPWPGQHTVYCLGSASARVQPWSSRQVRKVSRSVCGSLQVDSFLHRLHLTDWRPSWRGGLRRGTWKYSLSLL